MATTMWVTLAFGVAMGFPLGRWSAESRRARYDMDRIWNARKNYRDDD